MTTVDIVAAVAVLLYALAAYRTGFIVSLISFGGWLLSLLAAVYLFRIPLDWFGESALALILSFVLIFMIVQGIWWMIFRNVIRTIPPAVHKSPANRLFGLPVGGAKGVIIVGMTLLVLGALPGRIGQSVNDSRSGEFLQDHGKEIQATISRAIPEEVTSGLGFITVNPGDARTVDIPRRTRMQVDAQAEQRMLELVNEERRQRGLKALRIDPRLRTAARKHSKDMFQRGYFSHITPDNVDPFERMRRDNVQFMTAGENLALAPNVRIAHDGLMNSPGHKANILRPAFGRVGIGVQTSGSMMMFTQKFAN